MPEEISRIKPSKTEKFSNCIYHEENVLPNPDVSKLIKELTVSNIAIYGKKKHQDNFVIFGVFSLIKKSKIETPK